MTGFCSSVLITGFRSSGSDLLLKEELGRFGVVRAGPACARRRRRIAGEMVAEDGRASGSGLTIAGRSVGAGRSGKGGGRSSVSSKLFGGRSGRLAGEGVELAGPGELRGGEATPSSVGSASAAQHQ